MRDGQWIVPPEQRPKGWERMGCATAPEPEPEPEPEPATPPPAPIDLLDKIVAENPAPSPPERPKKHYVGSRWRSLMTAIDQWWEDNCGDDTRYREAALVMLSGIHSRDPHLISRASGLPPDRVEHWIEKLLASGVWTKGGKVLMEEGETEWQTSVGLVLMVGSVVGDFVRVPDGEDK